MGGGGYSSIFLDLGTRWRWVVSITPLPLYPRGKRLRYPLNRRLGEPQSRFGRCEQEKNLALPGIEPRPSLYRLNKPNTANIEARMENLRFLWRSRTTRFAFHHPCSMVSQLASTTGLGVLWFIVLGAETLFYLQFSEEAASLTLNSSKGQNDWWKWTGNDVKASGDGLIQVPAWHLPERARGKLQKVSVRTLNVPAKIRTSHLQNTSHTSVTTWVSFLGMQKTISLRFASCCVFRIMYRYFLYPSTQQ
jgi:hypothetical protein